eukprot:608079-Rhodomonas_salina.1
MNAFFEYALGHENVYVVTVNQLLDYLSDPVPAATFAQQFTKEKQCPVGGYLPRDFGLNDPEPSTSAVAEGTSPEPVPDTTAVAEPTEEIQPETTEEAEETTASETAEEAEPTTTFAADPPTTEAEDSEMSTTAASGEEEGTMPTCGDGCSECKAIPGNNADVGDATCTQCAKGYEWWPCNMARGPAQLCYCADKRAEGTTTAAAEETSTPEPEESTSAEPEVETTTAEAEPTTAEPTTTEEPEPEPTTTPEPEPTTTEEPEEPTTAPEPEPTTTEEPHSEEPTTTPEPEPETCGSLADMTSGCDLWVLGDLAVESGYVAGKMCVGGVATIAPGFTVGETGEGVDVAGDHERLLALSDHLAGAPAGYSTSAAVIESGVILIELDATQPRHAVALDAGLFAGHAAWALRISASAGSLEDVALVVINLQNVLADGLVINKYMDFSVAVGARVLWNHIGSEELAIAAGGALHGSVLAPRAALASASSGAINGQVIVASYASGPASACASGTATLFNSLPLAVANFCAMEQVGVGSVGSEAARAAAAGKSAAVDGETVGAVREDTLSGEQAQQAGPGQRWMVSALAGSLAVLAVVLAVVGYKECVRPRSQGPRGMEGFVVDEKELSGPAAMEGVLWNEQTSAKLVFESSTPPVTIIPRAESESCRRRSSVVAMASVV